MVSKRIAAVLVFSIFNLLCKGYFSQPSVGQDNYLNEHIFKGKKNGIFVDIGAHDGITHSNTYFFEKELHWTGICIEPLPIVFEKLKQNRKSILVNGCIGLQSGESPFLMVEGYPEMLSGLQETYDPRHLDRLHAEIAQYGGSYTIALVKVYLLMDLLKLHEITHIDYLSIDTEGSEFAILKTIDFDRVTIDVLSIENNYKDEAIRRFLSGYGFSLVAVLGNQDEIYVNAHSSFTPQMPI